MSITEGLFPGVWYETGFSRHFRDGGFIGNLNIGKEGLRAKSRAVKITRAAQACQFEALLLVRAITDQSGRWYARLIAPVPRVVRHHTDAEAGLDLRAALTVAVSEGANLDRPKLLCPGEVERLQRRLASRKKGSTKREQKWIEENRLGVYRCDFIATLDPEVKNMVWTADAKVENQGKLLGQKWGFYGATACQVCSSSERRCRRTGGFRRGETPHPGVYSGPMGPTSERRSGMNGQSCTGTCFREAGEEAIRGRDVLRR